MKKKINNMTKNDSTHSAKSPSGDLGVLTTTDYNFGQTYVYHGKVRDVYFINDDLLIMIATDRISAFDVILPKGIPYKGQVLNQIAAKFLDATADIVPHWKLATPDPMVTVGLRCEPFKVEMVIRGYLTGSAWREYKAGTRTLCGISLPDGMRENEKFPSPIITPTTKADTGHDENISKAEIIAQGLVNKEDYEQLEQYTQALFQRGTEIAAQKGLILVDTKYEFGKKDGKIYLIDEIHTPDSSRYFYAEGYRERFERGEEQKQLSKEFVRKWLMENGFQGKEGQKIPEMTPEYCESVSERYIELYEKITGEPFVKSDIHSIYERIEKSVHAYLIHNS
jgi:phosphoribosylaminoimidazole-succinocarboxamide synthase